MNNLSRWLSLFTLGLLLVRTTVSAGIIFEATSPYHHIRVSDANGMRTLLFDDMTETRVSLQDPLQGHFEYTQYFHMLWLWNPNATNILMIGLGGASTQRSFEHYHPETRIESVDIDPVVAKVAREYFYFKESDRQKLNLLDGRMFLRRAATKYDAILLDAYTQGRYGSSIPPHLVTREFFELARDHLTTNGVVAYNIITTLRNWNTDIEGAMYRTMKEVFPNVYIFRARSSANIVMIAVREKDATPPDLLRRRALQLVESRRVVVPNFVDRLGSLQTMPPANYQRCPVLTDDFAPVEGLIRGEGAK